MIYKKCFTKDFKITEKNHRNCKEKQLSKLWSETGKYIFKELN